MFLRKSDQPYAWKLTQISHFTLTFKLQAFPGCFLVDVPYIQATTLIAGQPHIMLLEVPNTALKVCAVVSH